MTCERYVYPRQAFLAVSFSILIIFMVFVSYVGPWNQGGFSRVPYSSSKGSPLRNAIVSIIATEPINYTVAPGTSARNKLQDVAAKSAVTHDKTVAWQIQYWGYYRLLMKDGVYYCPDMKASVRFTSAKGYDVMWNSHVAILHLTGSWNLKKLLSTRRKDQILAYWTRESPHHSPKSRDLSAFNWTISYRLASDFVTPYGRLNRYNSSRNTLGMKPELKNNWAENKTKLVAWIASNCDKTSWKRLGFVNALQRFINIDTFGKCGKTPCNGDDCIEKLRFYKFYLALENDNCEDYITEKFWKNGFKQGTVPIAFGAKRSDFEKVVPKESFIHVNDFANISSLVAYIEKVDQNNSMYNQFFEWRREFYVEPLRQVDSLDPEMLCAMVKKYNESLSRVESFDKTKWFHESCHKAPLPAPV